MVHTSYPSGGRVRRRGRGRLLLTAALLALAAGPAAFLIQHSARTPALSSAIPAERSPVAEASAAGRFYDRAVMDFTPTLAPERLRLAQNAPLGPSFAPAPARQEPAPQPAVAAVPEAETPPVPPAPPMRLAQAEQPVPLPVPRPTVLGMPKPAEAAPAARVAAPARSVTPPGTAQPAAAADGASFIERLFGIKRATPPESALAYAALENGTGSIAPGARLGTGVTPDGRTAVYDISAKVVIMPNGERLEAHSGLGDKLDDPRYVHVRMRGPTPPGTYILTEREKLFHGVRALRMTPVGGSAAIHGRDGILAHTYMLGPNGDSNGCISFRNYDRFLQAYLRGEVKRIVVVAGHRQDMLPRLVDSPPGGRLRPARAT